MTRTPMLMAVVLAGAVSGSTVANAHGGAPALTEGSIQVAKRRRTIMHRQMSRNAAFWILGCTLATALPRLAEGRLVRLSVETREPFVGGISWGTTGPYERLLGTAYMEVNPRDPLNAVIVDLDNFKSINDTHGHFAGDGPHRSD